MAAVALATRSRRRTVVASPCFRAISISAAMTWLAFDPCSRTSRDASRSASASSFKYCLSRSSMTRSEEPARMIDIPSYKLLLEPSSPGKVRLKYGCVRRARRRPDLHRRPPPPDVGGLRRGWTDDRSDARTMRHRSGFLREAAGSVSTNACSDGSCTYRLAVAKMPPEVRSAYALLEQTQFAMRDTE